MPRHAVLSFAVIVLVTLACARTGSGASNIGPDHNPHILNYAQLERTYYLLEPTNSLDPAPLVLCLHGGGGNGLDTCDLVGGIQELAEREGFLVACPEGVENHWNDGRSNDRHRAHIDNIDDVGFLLALIHRISSTHNVDLHRIYFTGASNGGMMSLRMACEASDVISAVGAVTFMPGQRSGNSSKLHREHAS